MRYFAWLILLLGLASPAAAQTKGQIRVAYGDNPGVDKINFLIAAERAKERGVAIKVSYLQSEDMAAQAVLSGLVDIGAGTPYSLIHKHGLPVRMFYQLSRLRFFPVVNSEFYRTWNDLDGAEIFTHGVGSGTDAVMKIMAAKEGIEYGRVIHIPGSSIRARGMLEGRIRATIVDAEAMRLLMENGKGRFTVLPTPGISASDELLYANVDFLRRNDEAVGILLEELLTVWRDVNKNPESAIDAAEKYGLLTGGWAGEVSDIQRYYSEATSAGLFSDNGGLGEFQSDLEVYGVVGGASGGVDNPKLEDFWYFEPLIRALERLGSR